MRNENVFHETTAYSDVMQLTDSIVRSLHQRRAFDKDIKLKDAIDATIMMIEGGDGNSVLLARGMFDLRVVASQIMHYLFVGCNPAFPPPIYTQKILNGLYNYREMLTGGSVIITKPTFKEGASGSMRLISNGSHIANLNIAYSGVIGGYMVSTSRTGVSVRDEEKSAIAEAIKRYFSEYFPNSLFLFSDASGSETYSLIIDLKNEHVPLVVEGITNPRTRNKMRLSGFVPEKISRLNASGFPSGHLYDFHGLCGGGVLLIDMKGFTSVDGLLSYVHDHANAARKGIIVLNIVGQIDEEEFDEHDSLKLIHSDGENNLFIFSRK